MKSVKNDANTTNRIVTILYYIPAICFYIASLISFFKDGDSSSGVVYFCIGSVFICLGSVYLNKDADEENKNKKQILVVLIKMYKTVVIEYSPKAEEMAQKVEKKANEMLQEGYELVTMSITGTAKAILVFKKV